MRGKNAQGDGETVRSDELTDDDAYNCYLQTLPKLYAGLVPLLSLIHI